MTNNLKIGNVKIFSTLEDDPHVASSLPSEMDVQDAASSLIPGQSSTPFGLVVECSHWSSVGQLLREHDDAQGRIQTAPRYTPPAYMMLDPQMTKESNDKLQLWIDSTDALKR